FYFFHACGPDSVLVGVRGCLGPASGWACAAFADSCGAAARPRGGPGPDRQVDTTSSGTFSGDHPAVCLVYAGRGLACRLALAQPDSRRGGPGPDAQCALAGGDVLRGDVAAALADRPSGERVACAFPSPAVFRFADR